VWIASLPLDRVHAAREEINWSKPSISIETLEKYDLLLLASLIRLYLLELPECLFTFELYEPCKLLYASRKSPPPLFFLDRFIYNPTHKYN
jgi:hypothetical protein